jgi:carboxymethylproline synthase
VHQSHELVVTESIGRIAVVTLNHPNKLNPIGRTFIEAISEALRSADANEEIAAIVLTGGPGRSFCAGGDFNEAVTMREGAEVDAWIDRMIALYVVALTVGKPLVGALDGYAIGLGFQLALCTDWRVATPDTQMIMWELEKGVACTVGATMLEPCLGRLRMTEIVYGCAPIEAARALTLGLVNEIAEQGELVATAIRTAERFAAYPPVPFHQTKSYINTRFIADLKEAAAASRSAHRESFARRSADGHFHEILKRPLNSPNSGHAA